MIKTLLTSAVLLFSIAAKSQSQDTLKVKYTLLCSDRCSHDTVVFKASGDTLIVTENMWKGYPSKPIAIRSYLKDTLVVVLSDTGRGFLTADCRVITTFKIPNAFKNNSLDVKFQGKIFKVNLIIDGLTSNLTENQVVNIYPNPTKNILIIETPEACNSIIAYNSPGEQISVINQYTSSINLENYPSGSYYLFLLTTKGVVKRAFHKL